MTPAAHEIDPRHLLEQMLLIRAYEEAIVAGYDQLMKDFGRIDCVFANSGASPRYESVFDMPTEHWFEFQKVALHGAFFTLREGARHMKARAEAGEPGGSLWAAGFFQERAPMGAPRGGCAVSSTWPLFSVPR